jgi:hypothetical protein
MRKRPLIVVEWDDITTNTDWDKEDIDHTKDALSCISVGWRLKSTNKHLVLTPMRTKDGRCNDRQIIPKGAIRSIRRIE